MTDHEKPKCFTVQQVSFLMKALVCSKVEEVFDFETAYFTDVNTNESYTLSEIDQIFYN